MKNRNTITLTLMISSILLLVVLQFLWIRNSYEKAFYDFRRETSVLFRSTVLTMRDSLFAKNIESVPGDSSKFILESRTLPPLDSVRTKIDSNFTYMGTRDKSAKVQVFVSSTSSIDTLTKDDLSPLASKIQSLRINGRPGAQRSFIIRLSPDTLSRDSIAMHYQKALAHADIYLPFKIKYMDMPEHRHRDPFSMMPPAGDFSSQDMRKSDLSVYNDTVTSDPVRLNPMTHYSVSLTKVRSLLLRQITPEILFSLFLSIITIAAFLLLYRNIRSQHRLMELKNDFISNVTHELKTPVATVSVALEALRNFRAIDNPTLTQEYLDIAQNELNRLSLMTDKILKTSVFESKGIDVEKTEVDISQIVEEVVESMKLISEKQKATLTITKEGHDFRLMGGAIHLTNIVSNLLDNALKYSDTGALINIRLQEAPGKIIFSIQDNGPGIAQEYQKKIFEKFFRVPTGNVHNTKGYGLGLSYVASVVESHGGKIDVESEMGKGSLFIIVLPK